MPGSPQIHVPSAISEKLGSVLLFERFAGGGRLRPPFLARERGFHELVTSTDREVFVLIHDAAISFAVVRTVVALLNQCPRLLLLLLLGINEFFDVAVRITKRVHLRCTTGLAAGLHDVGDLVINFQEAHRAAWATAAAEFFARRTDRCQISARARTELEQHRLGIREVHDAFHVVFDGLDEARAALGIFVLSAGALGFVGLGIEKPITLGGIFADSVLMIEADVEPDGGIECAVLIHGQPSQLVEKYFAIRFGEITILDAPVGNGAGDAMDELAHGGFALRSVLFAVEIFRHDNLRREHRP